MIIDTSFDFRSDSGGRDPDQHSPTLRRYHQFLWSKPLPDGRPFDLTVRGRYLHHASEAGEFLLASDSVIQTFARWRRTKDLIARISSEDVERFRGIGYTIGGMLLFPGNMAEGKMTINAARGCNRAIADRIDLTLECIRRHYLALESPLAATLARYRDFFALFGDFPGYVDFFLLNDLVTPGDQRVRFLAPFAWSAPQKPLHPV